MKKRRMASFNLIKMTQSEYEASVTALNLFFGAILGVSLGNLESTSTGDYITLLILTSAAVMSIIFVTYSNRTITSLIVCAGILGALWGFDYFEEPKLNLPDKLLPTLGVWLLLAFVNELWKGGGGKPGDEG